MILAPSSAYNEISEIKEAYFNHKSLLGLAVIPTLSGVEIEGLT